jgi:hypothetical protein
MKLLVTDRSIAPAGAGGGRLEMEEVMEPVFLGMVFAIMWLSASLFAAEVKNLRAAERRHARCPIRVR